MIARSYFVKKTFKFPLVAGKEGFTLIELVIALAILMLIVFAFTPLLVGSVERIFYAGAKSEALYQGQAEMEVNIFQKDTIDGHEVVFEFGEYPDVTTVTVPGGMIEIEQSQGEAMAWLSTFLPYVPSIRLSTPFLDEGYDGDPTYFPMVILGHDTKLENADYVYIYTRDAFEQGDPVDLTLPFQLVAQPLDQPPGYDQYATFDLPAGPAGITNANSRHIVELRWMVGEIQVNVRARLSVLLPAAVAVGEGGEIVVSPDAQEIWNRRNSAVSLSSNINDLLWAYFRYIAVTSDGKILLWGNQEEPAEKVIAGLGSVSLNSITYGNGYLVAVGNAGTVVVSTDGGESWSKISIATTENLHAVSFDGIDEFRAVGNNGVIISSTNPSDSWTVSLIPETYLRMNDLAYGKGAWFVAGSNASTETAGNIRYAIFRENADGTWTQVFTGSSNSTALYGLIYSDHHLKFIAVGTNGRIFTSTDGNTWTGETVSSYQLNNIYWDQMGLRHYIIVGNNGTIITGDMGDWTIQASGSSANLKGVSIRWEN